jgi:hypothetical protein
LGIVLLAAAVLAAGAVAAWFLLRPAEGSMDALRDRLPQRVDDWVAADGPTLYDVESIYGYINGHAEVYLAYGMRDCLALRYSGPDGEPDLVLDLFRMGSPADAFGVFTHDQEGRSAGVGQDSLLRYGWLSFWKGSYFVSILAESETDRSTRTVVELGRTVAALIEDKGSTPPIIADLPQEDLVERSVRFLRDPQILATHVPFATGNPFGLERETPAALGAYAREGERSDLLLVDYPDPATAAGALKAFRSRFVPAGHGSGPAKLDEEGWFAAASSGRRLVAVLGASTEEFAKSLLDRAHGPVGEGEGR